MMCYCCPKRYTIFTFLWDFFWFCVTGGFWLVWIFAREIRGSRRCRC